MCGQRPERVRERIAARSPKSGSSIPRRPVSYFVIWEGTGELGWSARIYDANDGWLLLNRVPIGMHRITNQAWQWTGHDDAPVAVERDFEIRAGETTVVDLCQ